MSEITFFIEQDNGTAFSVHSVFFRKELAIECLKRWYDTGFCSLTVDEAVKTGYFCTLKVAEKDFQKIIKQGYFCLAFEYHLNDYKRAIPIIIKSSKSALVKEYRNTKDPSATLHSLFAETKVASIFAVDEENIPNGFIKVNGLRLI